MIHPIIIIIIIIIIIKVGYENGNVKRKQKRILLTDGGKIGKVNEEEEKRKEKKEVAIYQR